MEALCEFCGVVRALVYCKSDCARLCLPCDEGVHSANYLSRRHPRSLVCDSCYSQSAVAHCLDDKMSLCQGCDWNRNGCFGLGHRRQALNCYSGCPSLAEFSRMFPFVFDATSSGGFDNDLGSFNTLARNDSCTSKSFEQLDNEGSFDLVANKLNESEPCAKYEPWMGQPSMIPPNPNYMPYCKDQPFLLPLDSNLPKVLPFIDFFMVRNIWISIPLMMHSS